MLGRPIGDNFQNPSKLETNKPRMNHFGIIVSMILVAGSGFSCTNHHIVSSPEGTVTSFVEDSGVLVYAPRSARAQKVVFDTSDQQLIHKPDTPFRKFFDSHAGDFANKADLEYAKTTILADIVNMVRNKEFIREMIKKIVYDHLDSAIAPSNQLTQPLLEARNALTKLKRLVPALSVKNTEEGEKNSREIIVAAKEATIKVAEAADSACLGVPPELNQLCKKEHDFFHEAWELYEKSRLENAFIKKYDFSGVHKNIQALTNNLSKMLRNAGNQTFLPISQIPSLDDSTLRIRKRNAELLVNELYKDFEAADYPNMRLSEISQRMEDFLKNSVWNQTTVLVGFPAEDGKKMVAPSEDLKKHLAQALLEQRYFRLIIDRAVEKRKNLFFTKSSPVQPMKTAQARLEKFLKENVGDELVNYAGDGSTSLWDGFLSHLNGTQTTKGIFVQPGTELILNKGGQIKFSTLLRKKLAGSLKEESDLEKSMRTILQDPEIQKYLRATDEKPLGKNDPNSLEERRKAWVEALQHIPSVKDAYTKLGEEAKTLQTVKAARSAAQQKRDEAKKAYDQAVLEVIGQGGLQKVEEFVKNKEIAFTTLSEIRGTLSPDQYDTSIQKPTDLNNNTEINLMAQAKKIYELGDTWCGTRTDPKCTENETFWTNIQSKHSELTKAIISLDSDEKEANKLKISVKIFSENPPRHSKGILQGLSQFQLKYDEIKNTSASFQESIKQLADLWCGKITSLSASPYSKPCGNEDIEKWTAEFKENLTNHSPESLANKASTVNDSAQTYVPGTQPPDPKTLFQAVIANHTTLEAKEDAFKQTENVYEKQYKSYLAAEKESADSFVQTLEKEITTLNKKKEKIDQLESSQTEQIKQRINNFLASVRDGDGLDAQKTVKEALEYALAIPLQRDINGSIAAFATQFAASFRNHPQLILSDGPILKAFLESDGITFNNLDFRDQATNLIPAAFVAAWKEKTATQTGTNGNGDPTNQKKAVTVLNVNVAADMLKRIVEQPHIAYLFGDDGTTAPVIGAFKEELYNAFKHKVFEAVRAEQEADYSYWWLTFYPKAIPLGDQRLEGQSVIEVGFPNSLTPEEQYHRWLQDQVGGLCSGDCDEGENNYRLKVQAATSVLNDFLIVLDSTELTRKYPKVRGIITRAIAELTDSQNGKMSYQNNYANAVNYLYQETLREWDFTPPPPFEPQSPHGSEGFSGESTRAGTKYLATFSPNFSCQNLNNFKVDPSLLRNKTPISCSSPPNLEDNKKRQESRKQIRERAGNDLAWDRFDVMHILFAVTSAAETQETLPFKIELYANAFFDGSRRFATFVAEEEVQAERAYLGDNTKNLMQDSNENTPVRRLERFLRLSGTTEADTQNLNLEGFNEDYGMAETVSKFNKEIYAHETTLYEQILKDLLEETNSTNKDSQEINEKINATIEKFESDVKNFAENFYNAQQTTIDLEIRLGNLRNDKSSLEEEIRDKSGSLTGKQDGYATAKTDKSGSIGNLEDPNPLQNSSATQDNNIDPKAQELPHVGEPALEAQEKKKLIAELLEKIKDVKKEILQNERDLEDEKNKLNEFQAYLVGSKMSHEIAQLIELKYEKETARYEINKKKIENLKLQGAYEKLQRLLENDMAAERVLNLAKEENLVAKQRSISKDVNSTIQSLLSHVKERGKEFPVCPKNATNEEYDRLIEQAQCTEQAVKQAADAATRILERNLQMTYTDEKLSDAQNLKNAAENALDEAMKEALQILGEGTVSQVAVPEKKEPKEILRVLRNKQNQLRKEISRQLTESGSQKLEEFMAGMEPQALNRYKELHANAQQNISSIQGKRAFVQHALFSLSTPVCSYPELGFKGIRDFKVLEKNPYLAHSELWCEEMDLQAFRESLRNTVVNVFQTNYPGVPDRVRLKRELSGIPGYLRSLVYQWLRSFWMTVEEEQILSKTKMVHHSLDMCVGQRDKERFNVLLNHFLDVLPGLTQPSRVYLMNNLGYMVKDNWIGSDPDYLMNDGSHSDFESNSKRCLNNRNIYDWIHMVTSNQKLMDELSKHLIDNLYKSYWEALGKLSRIERHPVHYRDIQEVKFQEFSHWAKPHVQPGIQIIDVLPASRDDLVAMSINEGGTIAKIAAQAEGAAAYDMNKLRMGAEVLDDLRGNWKNDRDVSSAKSEEPIEGFDATVTEQQRVSDAETLIDRSSLRQKTESFGYGAGGRAKGSIYARAKAALAYSKRREYLDAAITASGRGDNFAKWVVRRSDLRSSLAPLGTGSGTLVAAAHSGYPNGDQPFHLLVKIPDRSLQRDWDGKEYILFNSAYTATKRFNAFKGAGWLGLLTKGALSVVNPAWWEDVEESIVGTVYPFKWNVFERDWKGQIDMLKVPNTLGGRIYLDDTDKVKYSEVRTLIEAESAFIKSTRSAQNGDLTKLMGDIQEEAEKFRGEVNTHLESIGDEERKRLADERDKNKRGERIQSLQEKKEEPAPESY